MKIAVIGAKGLPAKQGGIERYCQELYPKLVAQGHQVDLFARPSYTQKRWFSSYDYQGVRVICLPSLPIRGLDAFTSSGFGALATVLKGDYDIVHFHALGPALFCFLPKLASRAGVVVTCQGLDWQRAKWGKWSSQLIRWGEEAAVNYADDVVVVSRELQDYFRKSYGRQTVYIPNAPGTYGDSDHSYGYVRSLGLAEGKYVLFLGRMVPEKRPDLLLEAYQRLKPEGWKLVLAGGDSDTAEYTEGLCQRAGGCEEIIFTGELQGARLAEVVRGAGLFVLPSDLEGLPLVMLEVMREGVPVVASDIAAHRQLIGSERGLLFRAGDVDDCVRVLAGALAQPDALQHMAFLARQHVAIHYTWEKITRENWQLYRRVRGKQGYRAHYYDGEYNSPEEIPVPVTSPELIPQPSVSSNREQAERLQACLQELTDLLYEQVNLKKSKDRENLKHTLRQEVWEQVNRQVELVLSRR